MRSVFDGADGCEADSYSPETYTNGNTQPTPLPTEGNNDTPVLPVVVCDWENTVGLFQTATHYGEGFDHTCRETQLYISLKLEPFLQRLEADKNAFIIESSNFAEGRDGRPLYEWNSDMCDLPVEISPYGRMIRINPNYLLFNPIELVGGTLEELMIIDDYTLNILVPLRFQYREQEIVEAFRELFFFEKVEVANIFNEDLGKPLDETKIDDLSVNVIYYYDGQSFFTFCVLRTIQGNERIIDPTVAIFTHNLHPNWSQIFVSSNTMFPSDANNADDALAEIMPFLEYYNLTDIIRLLSVYDEYRLFMSWFE